MIPRGELSPEERERRRAPRKPRAKTVDLINMRVGERRERARVHLEVLQELAEAGIDPAARPRTRAECQGGPRPCPWVSCRHNLYLEVSQNKMNVRLIFPSKEPHEMPARSSCALDIAERGPHRLEAVGRALNIVRERVRQIEERAIVRLLVHHPELATLLPWYGAAPSTRIRRLP